MVGGVVYTSTAVGSYGIACVVGYILEVLDYYYYGVEHVGWGTDAAFFG